MAQIQNMKFQRKSQNKLTTKGEEAATTDGGRAAPKGGMEIDQQYKTSVGKERS